MNKPILDVACGGKMFYFNKEDPRVLFCDKRRIKTTLCDGRNFDVSPDIQADFTNLPFEDNCFKLVIFDPPHLVHKGTYEDSQITGWQQIKYGALYDDWHDMITKGFSECFRVLDKNGVLVFKWNETDILLREILKCTSEKPVLGHKSGKRSNTHWILFFKEN